jgi:mRNA interferase RelE/StbE
MPYTVSIKPKVEKHLDTIRDARPYRRLRDAISGLAVEPRPPGYRKMQGEDDLYRIRVGDHRIIYQIQDAVLLVLVVQIGNRREIYRT